MTVSLDFTNPAAILEEARRRQARRAQGLPLTDSPTASEASDIEEEDGGVAWQEVQRRCYRVFANAGCTVYWLSQARKTGQTPGLPDLLVFGPPGAAFLLMWESKAGRGKLSDAQRKFALHCQRTKTNHAAGGERAARLALRTLVEQVPGETHGENNTPGPRGGRSSRFGSRRATPNLSEGAAHTSRQRTRP